MTFNQEKINEQYQKYLQQKAQREAEQKQLADEQAQINQQKQENYKKSFHESTLTKTVTCNHCGATIQMGEKSFIHSKLTWSGHGDPRYANTWTFKVTRYCQKCKSNVLGEN